MMIDSGNFYGKRINQIIEKLVFGKFVAKRTMSFLNI